MSDMATPAQCRQRGVFTAQVLANRPICREHYLLRLSVAGFPASVPGQFVNVRCGRMDEHRPRPVPWSGAGLPRLSQPELAGRQPLLRRPFSLAGRRDRPDGTAELEVIHHVVGVGTALLAELSAGDEVDLLGPLGNGFSLPGHGRSAALVGGGVGIPPLLYLAEALRSAGSTAVAFAGARTAHLLPLTIDPREPPSQAGWPTMCTAEFGVRGVPTAMTTDDGSLGATGLVHEALERWLDDRQERAADLAVYACGPQPMMKAVAGICHRRAIPCQLALERHMACGMGTCQGCVVRVKAETAQGWAFKLVCKDGPVFDAEELAWDL